MNKFHWVTVVFDERYSSQKLFIPTKGDVYSLVKERLMPETHNHIVGVLDKNKRWID